MRIWRETRDAILALLALAGLIALAIAVERLFGNPDLIEAGGAAVRAVDGDSLRVGDSEIRLHGIDAPEFSQSCLATGGNDWLCGREAREALAGYLREPGLACQSRATDRYGRMIAACATDHTPDIGEAMVRNGWAVSLEIGGTPSYPFAEAEAERRQRGIWQGEFERPADWRSREN